MRFLPTFLRVRSAAAWITMAALAALMPGQAVAAASAAQRPPIDVRHIIPPFNPALDAVHAPAGFGTGKIWHVGPHRTYKRPRDVVGLVHNGDIVEIDAGTYKCVQSVKWRANNLTLVGVGGRAIMDATGCRITGGKGIWNPRGNNLIVDNIGFTGARVPDQNGAGIRYDGTGYLYITHALFKDNQDGILYTPNQSHLATNNVVIDHSEFAHNGMPTGQAHNMYINECHSFVLRFSYSHDAIIGHEVKSRAYSNYILYNRIADEANGTASYDIDLPQGGLSYIIGNIIQKSPDSNNTANISYAVEHRINPVQRLYVAYNTIINDAAETGRRRVLFIRDKGLVQARLVDNLLVGFSKGHLLRGDGAGKVQLEGNVVTNDPKFSNPARRIYRLTAGSPAVGRAIDAGTGDGFPLTAKYEFTFPHGRKARPVVGKRDVGATNTCRKDRPLADRRSLMDQYRGDRGIDASSS